MYMQHADTNQPPEMKVLNTYYLSISSHSILLDSCTSLLLTDTDRRRLQPMASRDICTSARPVALSRAQA